MVDIKKASPFLIHIFMVLSVTAYTLFGAVVMRYIENNEIDKVNRENGFLQPLDAASHRSVRDTTTSDEKVVLTGTELALLAPDLHQCVRTRVQELMRLSKCRDADMDYLVITSIDDCYRNVKLEINETMAALVRPASGGHKYVPMEKNAEGETDEPWSFPNAVVFSYTVITTIGYGHVAPVSFKGRLFCIFYGLVGIPLTLLTIADIGMFLTKAIRRFLLKLDKWKGAFLGWMHSRRRLNEPSKGFEKRTSTTGREEVEGLNGGPDFDAQTQSSEQSDGSRGRTTGESIALSLIFVVYLVCGAFVISLYEPDMGLFKAFYFIFVSCTTVGLGDLVPRSYNYLFVTFIYITIGLALTTMAVEIAAEYLKKLHYFGRKIESVSQVEVWFGGRKMKLRKLIHHLGDQLNVPVEEMKSLNIENFVDSAIKVTEGEIKTLRKPEVVLRDNGRPLSYRDLRKSGEPSIFYADERSSILTGDSDKIFFGEDTGRSVCSDPRALAF